MESRGKNFCKYFAPIIFGASVLGLLTYYKAKFGIRLMESDSASDIFYAHLLSIEHKIPSDNWYFSTEFRFLDNTSFFALLFKLFPTLSWWRIETLGTAIMNGCLGMASVLLAYELKLGYKSLWMFGFSLLPYGTSEFYYTLMHGGGYYIFSIIEVFIALSLFLAIANNKGKHKTLLAAEIICYLGMSFLIGIQGIRLLANLYAPLLMSSICFMIYGLWQSKNIDRYQDLKQRKQLFGIAFGSTLMALIGYGINKFVLRNLFIWTNNEDLQLKYLSIDPIVTFINEILSNLGYIAGLDAFSIRGLVSLLSIIIFAIILAGIAAVCKKGKIFQQNNFIAFFFIMALSLHLFIYIFFQKEYKARYMLPFFMLFPQVICLMSKDWKPNIRKIALSILCISSILVSINVTYHWHLTGNHQGINIAKQQEMSDFLVENGYKYGFSTFWYANSTIQLSNGQLDVCPIFSTDVFDKFQWLSTKDDINYAYDGPVFFIVSDAQLNAGKERPWNQEEKIIWHDGGICVFVYDSVQELQSVVDK